VCSPPASAAGSIGVDMLGDALRDLVDARLKGG
jgi:hypothetical protein